MKNRDTILLLLVITLVTIFLWQSIQKLTKEVESVSEKSQSNANDLSQKLTSVNMAVTDTKTIQAVQSDRINVTPFDYVSSYESI